MKMGLLSLLLWVIRWEGIFAQRETERKREAEREGAVDNAFGREEGDEENSVKAFRDSGGGWYTSLLPSFHDDRDHMSCAKYIHIPTT